MEIPEDLILGYHSLRIQIVAVVQAFPLRTKQNSEMGWSICLAQWGTIPWIFKLLRSCPHLGRRLTNIPWTTLNVISWLSHLLLLFWSNWGSTTPRKSLRFFLLFFDWRRCLEAHGLIMIVNITWCLLFFTAGGLIRGEIINKAFYRGWTRIWFFYLIKGIVTELVLKRIVGVTNEFLLDSF